MTKMIDITGQRFERLTVISHEGRSANGHTQWKCKCDCGNEIVTIYQSLKKGCTKSCGCLRSELASERYKEIILKAYESNKKNDFKEGTSLCRLKNFALKNNTSGVKGVTWDKNRDQWLAQIVFKNHYYNLGRYYNFEDAVKARKAAEEKYFEPILDKYSKMQTEKGD